jgi:hypothetical protein
VIPFIQKTWFLCWRALATLFILRWFDLVSVRPHKRDLDAVDAADAGEAEAATASNQVPSGTASRLFTKDETIVRKEHNYGVNLICSLP